MNENCLLSLFVNHIASYEPNLIDIVKYYMKCKSFKTNEELKNMVKLWKHNRNSVERIYGHISEWKLINITCISYLFSEMSIDEDLSKWNLRHVKFMDGLFYRSIIGPNMKININIRKYNDSTTYLAKGNKNPFIESAPSEVHRYFYYYQPYYGIDDYIRSHYYGRLYLCDIVLTDKYKDDYTKYRPEYASIIKKKYNELSHMPLRIFINEMNIFMNKLFDMHGHDIYAKKYDIINKHTISKKLKTKTKQTIKHQNAMNRKSLLMKKHR